MSMVKNKTLNTILGSLAVLRTGVPDYPRNCWHVTSVNMIFMQEVLMTKVELKGTTLAYSSLVANS